MGNTNKLLKAALGRMESKIEPTGEDWYLLRMLMSKPLFSAKKRKIRDYLWVHLCKHHISELNEEERFTLQCLGCLTSKNC